MTKGRKQPEEKVESLPKRKAAAYLHSATSCTPDDPQDPAIREQNELIRAYAQRNNMDIVKTYIDGGKCGVDARSGLRNMIADAHSGAAKYEVILMRDISRWGREQPDESAHYEFICRRAGVDVLYVDEPLKNDGSVMSRMIKTMIRVVDEEYRRERAAKSKAARLRRKVRMAEASAETEDVHE